MGLEMAGFAHLALVEYEKDYCECLRRNRPGWNVVCQDVRAFDGSVFRGKVDLLAGGVPCPPFSVAGKQLGADDERDLFPQMLRLVREVNPRVVMIENVKGFLDAKFEAYRRWVLGQLENLGYRVHVQLLNASDFGVSQLRPRVVIVGVLLGETTHPGQIAISQFYNMPSPRSQMTQKRECFHQKIHIHLFKLGTRGLPRRFIVYIRHQLSGNAASNTHRQLRRTVRIARNTLPVHCQYPIRQQPLMIFSSRFCYNHVHNPKLS